MKPGVSLLLFNLLKLHFPRVDLLEVFFSPRWAGRALSHHGGRGSLDQG